MSNSLFRAYSLTGAYRKLLVRPEQLTWQLVRHLEETDNLIQSDYELLKGEAAPVFVDDGPLCALLVDFRLPSSTYATMVLREILKVDTSPANQTKLNKVAGDEAAAAIAEKRKLDEEIVNDEVEQEVKRQKVDGDDKEEAQQVEDSESK